MFTWCSLYSPCLFVPQNVTFIIPFIIYRKFEKGILYPNQMLHVKRDHQWLIVVGILSWSCFPLFLHILSQLAATVRHQGKPARMIQVGFHFFLALFYISSYFGGAVPIEPSESWRGFLAKTRFRREMRSPNESLSVLMLPGASPWLSAATAPTSWFRPCRTWVGEILPERCASTPTMNMNILEWTEQGHTNFWGLYVWLNIRWSLLHFVRSGRDGMFMEAPYTMPIMPYNHYCNYDKTR